MSNLYTIAQGVYFAQPYRAKIFPPELNNIFFWQKGVNQTINYCFMIKNPIKYFIYIYYRIIFFVKFDASIIKKEFII